MENEDPFDIEARDQARTERSSSVEPRDGKGLRSRITDAESSDDEQVPLMHRRHGSFNERPGAAARKSYERAINQPWTGAQGSAGLPWYKRPSVRASMITCVAALIRWADILASALFFSIHPCVWRTDCPQDLFDT